MARQRKPRMPRVVKRPYKLEGGPMHGHTLWLTGCWTLTFTLRGQTGHYNEKGVWTPSLTP